MAEDMCKFIKRWGISLAVVVVGGTIARSATFYVPHGYRAIIIDKFRGIQKGSIGEGIHFLVPFKQKAVIFDLRKQEKEVFSSLSSEANDISVHLLVVFRLDEQQLGMIYKLYGGSYEDPIISTLKKVMETYFRNGVPTLGNKLDLEAQLFEQLLPCLQKFHIILESFKLKELTMRGKSVCFESQEENPILSVNRQNKDATENHERKENEKPPREELLCFPVEDESISEQSSSECVHVTSDDSELEFVEHTVPIVYVPCRRSQVAPQLTPITEESNEYASSISSVISRATFSGEPVFSPRSNTSNESASEVSVKFFENISTKKEAGDCAFKHVCTKLEEKAESFSSEELKSSEPLLISETVQISSDHNLPETSNHSDKYGSESGIQADMCKHELLSPLEQKFARTLSFDFDWGAEMERESQMSLVSSYYEEQERSVCYFPIDGDVPVYQFEIHNSIVGLVIGVGGKTIKQLSTRTGARIEIHPHFNPTMQSTHQICQVRGERSAVNQCLGMLRSRFPTDRFPELDLSPVLPSAFEETEVFPISWLSLPERVPTEVFIICIISPGHFFIQQPTHPSFSCLASHQENMMEIYSCPSYSIPSLPKDVPLNALCAVPISSRWYRGVTTNFDRKNDIVTVKLVDFGGYFDLKREELKQIHYDLVPLPFQAIECYLAEVEPADGTQNWSSEAYEFFADIINERIIEAHVVGYHVTKHIPFVELTVQKHVDDIPVRLNRVLRANGHAKCCDPTKMRRVAKS